MKTSYGDKFKDRVFATVGDEYTFLEEYVKAKTKIKVRHNTCGHEYSVTPANFNSGKRCPKCFGSIKKTEDGFIKEVYNLVGNEYRFLEKYVSTHTPIEIIHYSCGNIYKVSPSAFLRNGTRCSKCANKGRKALSNDEFLASIDILVGDEYSFLESYIDTETKINVRHNVCGHVYKVSPRRFKSGNRCRKCRGAEQRKSNSDFTREVFDLVGNEYTFLDEYITAIKKLNIKHNTCGNIFASTPNNFLKGNRCPHCFGSKGEDAISKYLESNNIEFKKQVAFPDLKMQGLLRYDFGIFNENGTLKILIEYDGQQHFKPIEAWGGNSEFQRILESDKLKNSYAEANDLLLIRIPYWDYNRINEILESAIS